MLRRETIVDAVRRLIEEENSQNASRNLRTAVHFTVARIAEAVGEPLPSAAREMYVAEWRGRLRRLVRAGMLVQDSSPRPRYSTPAEVERAKQVREVLAATQKARTERIAACLEQHAERPEPGCAICEERLKQTLPLARPRALLAISPWELEPLRRALETRMEVLGLADAEDLAPLQALHERLTRLAEREERRP